MIIDVHTHIFPPDVIERRETFAKRDSSFDFIYGNPRARMVTYEALVEEMDTAGVDRSIVCGFPWRSLDMCRRHNTYMMEAVEAHPERFVGLATVNPVAGKACDTELERCFSGGLKGVGEISADAQGFRLDDESTTGRIVGAVEEAGLFVLLHANEDVGHFYPGKTPTTPASVYRFLEKFGDVSTILAHWAGACFSTSSCRKWPGSPPRSITTPPPRRSFTALTSTRSPWISWGPGVYCSERTTPCFGCSDTSTR